MFFRTEPFFSSKQKSKQNGHPRSGFASTQWTKPLASELQIGGLWNHENEPINVENWTTITIKKH